MAASSSHGLWDALKLTYDDTVEDDLYALQDGQDDGNDEEDWEKGIPPFVRKLTKMVGENKSTFNWTTEGSFIVVDVDCFSNVVLPRYFKSIKFCSFIRQLNMYGFHKVDDPTGADTKHFEFRNSNFIPGRRELLKKIERRKGVKRSTRGNTDDPTGKQPANQTRRASSTFPTPGHTAQQNGDPKSTEQGSADQGTYKAVLDTVVKLQQQSEINNLALKQVLDELTFYRKSHFELEHKLNQYISQAALAGFAPMPNSPQIPISPSQSPVSSPSQPLTPPLQYSQQPQNPQQYSQPQYNQQQPQQYSQPQFNQQSQQPQQYILQTQQSQSRPQQQRTQPQQRQQYSQSQHPQYNQQTQQQYNQQPQQHYNQQQYNQQPQQTQPQQTQQLQTQQQQTQQQQTQQQQTQQQQTQQQQTQQQQTQQRQTQQQQMQQQYNQQPQSQPSQQYTQQPQSQLSQQYNHKSQPQQQRQPQQQAEQYSSQSSPQQQQAYQQQNNYQQSPQQSPQQQYQNSPQQYGSNQFTPHPFPIGSSLSEMADLNVAYNSPKYYEINDPNKPKLLSANGPDINPSFDNAEETPQK